jgi:hypothetical protein
LHPPLRADSYRIDKVIRAISVNPWESNLYENISSASSLDACIAHISFGIYQGFTAFAEGYLYKILDLLAGTLLI